jgi:UDP-N-acetylmuramate--alanine ligase
LEEADVTLLLPVYSAGETSKKAVTSEDIFDIMKAEGHSSILCRDENEVFSTLDSCLREGDVLMTLGAGDVSQLGKTYLKRISALPL